jgi:hypothetical protein
MVLRLPRFGLADKARDRPSPHGIEALDHAVLFSSIFHSAHLDRAVGLLGRSRHLFLVGLSATLFRSAVEVMRRAAVPMTTRALVGKKPEATRHQAKVLQAPILAVLRDVVAGP